MKKKTTFQINIPTPCHEKWSDMTPANGGKHCDQCEKTVVDFTDKTDREISLAFQQSSGKVCGRFLPTQLKRDFVLNPKTVSSNMSKAAAVLLSGMLSASTLNAQTGIVVHQTEQHIQQKDTETTSSDFITISGQVIDESGEPLPFANVYIRGAYVGITADIDGYYTMKVSSDTEDMVVSYVGYPDVRIILDSENNGDRIVNVTMAEGYLLGDIVIDTYLHYSPQDPPTGRTFPRLVSDWVYNIGDWIQNIKEKRSKKTRTQEPQIIAPDAEEAIENEYITDLGSSNIITKKFITNIYPNPFDNKIQLTLESEIIETLRLVIYDAMSREIYVEQVNILSGKNEITLDLKEKQLDNGSYFLSVFRKNELVQTEVLTRVK